MNLRCKGRGPGQEGRLQECQGIGDCHNTEDDKDTMLDDYYIPFAGWWLAEKNIAQISLNLTDMDVNISHFFSVHT